MIKKFIVSLLLITIISSVVIISSCSDNGDNPTTTGSDNQTDTTTAAETEPLDALEARKLVDDELPQMDFGGADFRIISDDGEMADYVAEELNGDVINDAVYYRNSLIAERFNVNITIAYHSSSYGEVGNTFKNAVLAADDAFELISHHVVNAGLVALSNVYMNWNDIEYIDFSKPWWSKSTTEDLTYNGVTLLAIGDLSLSSLGRTYCVFFNKPQAESYSFPNLYDVVRDGAWTIGKLDELTKSIYNDVNGNGVRDFDDFYGFSTGSASNLGAYLWAFDNPVMKKDSSGEPILSVKTNKMNNIVEVLARVVNENVGTYTDKNYTSALTGTGGGHVTGRDMFYYGNTIMANGYVDMAIQNFRDIEDDYGIIPYPKFDEQQSAYHLLVDGNFGAFAVPKSVTNLELVGIITEALNAESYKSVVPAYYDIALKVKFTRDQESVEILDLLMDSRMFDFGYIYDGWAGCSFMLEGLVRDNNTNFESEYLKKETAVEKHFNEAKALFENYYEN
jgi:hypothetical protein